MRNMSIEITEVFLSFLETYFTGANYFTHCFLDFFFFNFFFFDLPVNLVRKHTSFIIGLVTIFTLCISKAMQECDSVEMRKTF